MISFARAVWMLPRAPQAPARVWRDWALVVVLTVVALLEAALRSEVVWLWPSLLLELGLIATLLWRRTHPGLVAVVAFGSTAAFDIVRQVVGVPPTDLYTFSFMLIVLYALARWGSGRELLLGGAIFAASAIRSFGLGAGLPEDLIGGTAVVAIPITLGAVIRYRATVRTERLEQVRLRERERLARDLHDTVAHHVTAIALRAQAGLATATVDALSAAEALRDIESEASLTLREMRSLVGVLREEGTALCSPGAGADELRALASSGGALPVTLDISGDLDSVPAPVATAVYRIAQESVTNARAHSDGATGVTVLVTVQTGWVRVRVHDDGRASSRRSQAPAGFGIVGMTERADLLGGTCTAGWDAAGGWTVTAALPVGAA